MRMMLLAAAAGLFAVAQPDAPVSAQSTASHGGGSSIDSGFPDWHEGDRRDRRRHRGAETVFVYDRDWQGNSAWRANSFNDWWHERPHRSFPRWMSANQDCQRVWQSGGAWRC